MTETGTDFLNKTQKESLIIKKKIDKLDFTILENICLLKGHFKKFKRQIPKKEKIFGTHITKKSYSVNPPNNEKTTNFFKERSEKPEQPFYKKISKWLMSI